MSIIIDKLPKVTVVSKFGPRVRNGIKENHPGIDIRVVDARYIQYPVIAQEDLRITGIQYSLKWGHAVHAKPINKNGFGIDGFSYWHIVPGVKVGDELKAGDVIGKPESGYVDLHLHFETLVKKERIDPVPYLESLGAEIEYTKRS